MNQWDAQNQWGIKSNLRRGANVLLRRNIDMMLRNIQLA
jgi:hypothetical protein